jgi:hypothetical protein
MPTEGLDNFNYDYLKGMNPLWCSTYRLQGNSGVITWGTGGTTVGFRRNENALFIGPEKDPFVLLNPCNGLVLEGTYKREDWKDEISPKQGITFSQNGSFVDEGFLTGAISSWWWADRGLVDANFARGNGSYHIADNSLVLLYADGRKVRANFHLADQDTSSFIISTRRFVKTQ